MDHIVKCTLAHPIGPKTADQVGLEPPDGPEYPAGTEIQLRHSQAMRLVSGGFILNADPQDMKSVQAALVPVKPPKKQAAPPAAASPAKP